MNLPGRPANWFPLRTLFFTKILANRLLRIEMKALRVVSNRVIGRVLLSRHSHGLGFSMGYILASRQALGIDV